MKCALFLRGICRARIIARVLAISVVFICRRCLKSSQHMTWHPLYFNTWSDTPCISAPINLNIISDKHIDTSSLTTAFQENFYNTTSETYDVVSGLSAQIVGPSAALEVYYYTLEEYIWSVHCNSRISKQKDINNRWHCLHKEWRHVPQGCKLRILGARAQNLVTDDSVVVAVESFINEIVPGT